MIITYKHSCSGTLCWMVSKSREPLGTPEYNCAMPVTSQDLTMEAVLMAKR